MSPWSSSWRPSDREARWSKDQFDEATFARIAPLVQERVATLGEVAGMIDFFFLAEVAMDDEAFDKTIRTSDSARQLLELAKEAFADVAWNASALHETAQRLGERLGLALRKSQAPIRCAVTGNTVGPPLFESLEILGRDETLRRLEGALARIAQ